MTNIPDWVDNPLLLKALLDQSPEDPFPALLLGGALLRAYGVVPKLCNQARRAVQGLLSTHIAYEEFQDDWMMREAALHSFLDEAESIAPDKLTFELVLTIILLRDDLQSVQRVLAEARFGPLEADVAERNTLAFEQASAAGRASDSRSKPLLGALRRVALQANPSAVPSKLRALAANEGGWWLDLAEMPLMRQREEDGPVRMAAGTIAMAAGTSEMSDQADKIKPDRVVNFSDELELKIFRLAEGKAKAQLRGSITQATELVWFEDPDFVNEVSVALEVPFPGAIWLEAELPSLDSILKVRALGLRAGGQLLVSV